MTRVPPYRERVFACLRQDTFKYYLSREKVAHVWERLASGLGVPHTRAGVLTLETPALILRAPPWGNPITVMRKSACRPDDVTELHALLEFDECHEAGP